MHETRRTNLDNLRSEDKEVQGKALFAILEATDQPVDWAYDVWNKIVETLGNNDNRQRAIAAQVLCNRAKSDPEMRMIEDFDSLLAVTKNDIIQGLRKLYDAVQDEGIKKKALELIETEEDSKYRKKYATLWKQSRPARHAVARGLTSLQVQKVAR